MKILVSGLLNIEITLNINEFPVYYYPIDYPFFGIKSGVSGVAYNIAKALKALGDDVELVSYIGKDYEGDRILLELAKNNIKQNYIFSDLRETPVSIVLYDNKGKRKIYCDLKDIQEKQLNLINIEQSMDKSDIVVVCNINFNRNLIKGLKQKGKKIATDVHVLSSMEDEYNNDFMQCADILFFSDEKLPEPPDIFLTKMKDKYKCEIFVVGMGEKGAMLYARTQNKIYYLPAAKAENIINTVGAGDALFSAFLHYYGKGFDAVCALERAQIFAAKKIEHNGASLGFCNEKQIEDIYRISNRKVQEIRF